MPASSGWHSPFRAKRERLSNQMVCTIVTGQPSRLEIAPSQ